MKPKGKTTQPSLQAQVVLFPPVCFSNSIIQLTSCFIIRSSKYTFRWNSFRGIDSWSFTLQFHLICFWRQTEGGIEKREEEKGEVKWGKPFASSSIPSSEILRWGYNNPGLVLLLLFVHYNMIYWLLFFCSALSEFA